MDDLDISAIEYLLDIFRRNKEDGDWLGCKIRLTAISKIIPELKKECDELMRQDLSVWDAK